MGYETSYEKSLVLYMWEGGTDQAVTHKDSPLAHGRLRTASN